MNGIKKFPQNQLKTTDSVLVIGNSKHCMGFLKDFKNIESFVVSTKNDVVIKTDYVFLFKETDESIIKLYYEKYGSKCCDSLGLFKDILDKCTSENLCLVLRMSGKDKVFWYELGKSNSDKL